jgi:Ca2+-binding RTX toxin-like protein
MATVNGTIYNDNDTWQNSVYYQSLQGTGKADTISGLGGNDILYGYGGADYLDGGSGADIMEGGNGDDTFMVDDINDIPREMHNSAQGGADTVNTSVTHTLGYGIEHLNLYGENFTLNSGKIDGHGNGNNNAINGSGGINSLYGYGGDDALAGGGDNDYLDGGTGADTMDGGSGNDIFMVDNIGDVTKEKYNDTLGGIDTVNASATHTLGYGIEHLNLYGENFTLNSGKIDGYGNGNNNAINGSGGINLLYGYGGDDALAGGGDDDYIYGGDGSDLLTGGMGKDQLNGGTGTDIFDVNYVSESPFGALKDVILDFSGVGRDGDKIDLSTIDANLSLAGDQVFALDQLSFATGVLTGDVIGGPDLQIESTGVSSLNLVTDVVA